MEILKFIDRFSFKQIISLALILAILFAIPTTVLLVQQQTRLFSSAHRSKLPPSYEVVQEPFGQPSAFPPKIEQIRPFLGKVDDVVFISGRNFGQNPQDRAVYFGSVKAHEADILKWHDDLIEVMVPEGAVSGLIRIVVAGREAVFNWPFTVYDVLTQRRVYWQGNNLMLENGFGVERFLIVRGGGQVLEGRLNLGQGGNLVLASLPNREIISVALYDSAGRQLPFYVNPLDFGF